MKIHKIKKKMLDNNWEENYIIKTIQILDHAYKNKHPWIKFLDKSLIWIALIVSVIGNFIISVSLAPLLLIVPKSITILIAIVLGVCFGLLIDIFIRDVDIISRHHYIIAGLFLPSLALINILIVSNIMKELTKIDKFLETFPNFQISDLNLVVLFYFVSFIAPHFVYKITEYFESKNVQQ